MTWWVENDSRNVRFRGEVSDRTDLEKVIAALTVNLPLLAPIEAFGRDGETRLDPEGTKAGSASQKTIGNGEKI